MKLIVGFGNPGKEYNFTRHNFGFLSLDFYAKINNLTFKSEAKFLAEIARTGDTLLVKPQTFYNDIGKSISKLVNFYKLDPKTDLVVVCDDFSLEFGNIRFREKGTDGGNNGLKSTIQYLNTTDFPRLRLGTDNPGLRQTIGDTDFVLGKFTPEEREKLPEILKTTSTKISELSA